MKNIAYQPGADIEQNGLNTTHVGHFAKLIQGFHRFYWIRGESGLATLSLSRPDISKIPDPVLSRSERTINSGLLQLNTKISNRL